VADDNAEPGTPGSGTMPARQAGAVPTVDECLANAARLLRAAELETNLALMERLERLADSWVSAAGLILQRDR
jgi:hypothetical protein